MSLIERAVPPPLPITRDRALARAQEILLSYGLTTVADMGTSAEDWAVMRRAGDAGRLNVRILSYASGIDNLLAVAGTRPTPWLYDGRLRMVGVKLYLDGALGSRGAWLKAPYRDAPGQRGLPLLTDTVLKNLMSRAAMDHFQVAVHAIGDAGQCRVARRDRGAVATPITATGAGGSSMPRSSIPPICRASAARHHRLDAADPRDLRLADGRGADGDRAAAGRLCLALDARQPRAARRSAPISRSKAPTPSPASPPRSAARMRKASRPAAGCREQRLTLEQAFAAFTRGGAYAGFAEDRLGTLEPGHMADFVFIDRDIFADADPAADPRDAGAGDLSGRREGLGAALSPLISPRSVRKISLQIDCILLQSMLH